MNISDLFARSIGGLLRMRSRTLFTTLSITVASFSLSMAISINHGGSAYVQKIVNWNTEPQSLWVMKKQDDNGTMTIPSKYTDSFPLIFNYISVKPLTDSDMDIIRNTSGVASAKPYIDITDAYVTRPDQDRYQAEVMAQRSNDTIYLMAGNMDSLRDEEVILPSGYSQAMQFSTPENAIGTNIDVTVRNISGPKVTTKTFTLKVAAIVKESSEILTRSTLRVTQNTIEQMNKFATKNTPMQGRYIAATAKVNSDSELVPTRDRVMRNGYEAETQADRDTGLTNFASVFQAVLLIFGVLAVVTAVFGITNTQYMSVSERIQEIGLMKALGMKKSDVAMLFRIEAGMIGFFGATVGVAFAVAIGSILDPLLIQTAKLDPDTLILQPDELGSLIVILGLTLVATIAGLAPAKRASRLDPIEALRNEAV